MTLEKRRDSSSLEFHTMDKPIKVKSWNNDSWIAKSKADEKDIKIEVKVEDPWIKIPL